MARVYCYNNQNDLQVRLAGGDVRHNGRVEIGIGGVWGAVCDYSYSWTATDAEVVCRSLGYPGGYSVSVETVNNLPYGRVVVNHMGYPGYICTNGFDNNDANVVCKEAGYSGGTAFDFYDYRYGVFNKIRWLSNINCAAPQFRLVNGTSTMGRLELWADGVGGTGGGQVLIDYASCTGRESSLLTCYLWLYGIRNYQLCSSHQYDAAIQCFDQVRITGSTRPDYGRVEMYVNSNWTAVCDDALTVRLVETVYGAGGYYGGVQVNRYGFWGPVCNNSWDDRDANATCHGLGYTYGITFYGRDRTGNPMLVGNFQCTGQESSLADCPFNDIDDDVGCSLAIGQYARVDAGVLCYNTPGVELRLTGGGRNYGRLEVQYEGEWGRVADYYFSSYDATIACKQLGYLGGRGAPYNMRTNGQGRVSVKVMIWMYYVLCGGKERTLFECYNYWNYRLSYARDANVICYNTREITVDFMNVTGRICSDGWDDTDAGVFCSERGFQHGKAYEHFLFSSYYYYSQNGPFWITQVNCQGTERSLRDCPKTLGTVSQCTSGKAAGVMCTNTDGIYYRLEGSNSGYKGRVEVAVDGQWGTVCRSYFDSLRIGGRYDPSIKQGPVQLYRNGTWYNLCDTDFDDVTARQVCRDLEFVDGKAVCCSAYGSWSYYVRAYDTHLNYTMRCDGTETSASACIRDSNCVSGNYASVVCYNSTDYVVDSIQYRLQDGPSPAEGRVEIAVGGVWGTVCDLYWDDRDAAVLCRTLNYSDGYAVRGAFYGQVKLNLGLNASMGAVMVYRKQAWSLICDSGIQLWILSHLV
nr:hypothetical protein BaRGS_004059 [Batillaria attramentaria]